MFQFPANPTIGQQFSPAQGVTYEWNGTGWIHLGISTASLYPAGIILPYAGAAPLPFQGWLLCDGSSYTTAAQPVLFAVIGYSYGGAAANFNVPDLRGRVVAGVDAGTGRLSGGTLGAPLGAERIALTAAELAAHAHGINDVAHNHGVSDPGHGHGLSDPGHAHGVADGGHGHGVNDGGHSHSAGEQGIALNVNAGTGVANFVGNADRGFVTVGGQTSHVGSNISIQGSGANIGIHAAGTGLSVAGAGTNISLGASGTGLSATQAAGSGGAHLNVQPTLCLNYIIKA